ncbi:hypothetical protein TKK_0017543 [Trichogramma kaykai]
MVRPMSKNPKGEPKASSTPVKSNKQIKLEDIFLASEEIRNVIMKSLEKGVEKTIAEVMIDDGTALIPKKSKGSKDEKEGGGAITAKKLNCGQLIKLELRKARERLSFFRGGSKNNNDAEKYVEQPSVVIRKPRGSSNEGKPSPKKSATTTTTAAVQTGALADGNEWSYKHAAFMLPCFDGSNPLNYANNWRNLIDRCSIAFSWTDQEAMKIARLRMDGPALEWLNSLDKPCTSWLEFQELFNDKFVEESDLLAKTFLRLSKRRRKRAESLDEYLEAMQRLADRIQLPEKHLVQFIVNGLQDELKAEADDNNDDDINNNNKDQRLDKVRSMDELRDYLDAFKERKAAKDALIYGLHRKKNDEDKICWNCRKRGHVYEFCSKYFDNSDIWKLFSLLSMSLVVFGF